MADLLHLDGNKWLSRAEMADKLGVSERTVTRQVNRGELVRKNNPNGRGKLYRRSVNETDDARHETRETGHETGQDKMPQSPSSIEGERDTRHARQDTRQDRTRDTAVSQLIARLEDRDDRIGELERQVGRLESENARLRKKLEDEPAGQVDESPDHEASRAAELVDALRRTADSTDD